jgi:hypothetical protein
LCVGRAFQVEALVPEHGFDAFGYRYVGGGVVAFELRTHASPVCEMLSQSIAMLATRCRAAQLLIGHRTYQNCTNMQRCDYSSPSALGGWATARVLRPRNRARVEL